MNRIEYFDSLRGLAILLVVVHHVIFLAFKYNAPNLITHPLCVLQMPLFFMISGFFTYKQCDSLSVKDTLIKIYKRFPPFILGALSFMTLYSLFQGVSIEYGIFGNMKNGYWFTITLFEFITLYYISVNAANKIGIKQKYGDWFVLSLMFLSFFVYLIVSPKLMVSNPQIHDLFGLSQFQYIPYFILGLIIHQYFDEVNRILKSDFFVAVLFIFVLWFFGFHDLAPINNPWLKLFFKILSVSCLILISLRLFQSNQLLCDNHRVGRSFKLLGRKSIAIYFIHPFFTLMDLSAVGQFFNVHNSPIVVYCCGIFLAVIIIVASLIVYKIIDINRPLSNFLFGIR